MRRQILFRGQRKDTGGWINGSLHIDHMGDSFISFCKTELVEGADYGLPVPYSHAVIEGSVGQYTTLLDRNRKDIFEGDIIQANHFPKKLIVGFCKESAAFGACTDQSMDINKMYWFANDIVLDQDDWYVIGNIHEHPELITVPNPGK